LARRIIDSIWVASARCQQHPPVAYAGIDVHACVAPSTRMVATGLVVLRRRSLKAFFRAFLATPVSWLRRA
jgi:hypothetical protein